MSKITVKQVIKFTYAKICFKFTANFPFYKVEQASKHEEALSRHRSEADSLRKKTEELRALLSASEGEVAKVRAELAESGKERDSALSDKLELEAKIASSADERRTLLERCLEVRERGV